jgi:hypothetical protein
VARLEAVISVILFCHLSAQYSTILLSDIVASSYPISCCYPVRYFIVGAVNSKEFRLKLDTLLKDFLLSPWLV